MGNPNFEVFLSLLVRPSEARNMIDRLRIKSPSVPRWQDYCERRLAFYQRASDRILRDHEVFLNRCPYCNSLARTPTAKQCGKCFKRWGEDAK
jgi:hypothetical protein